MVQLEPNRLLWRARVVRLEFNDLAPEVTWKTKPFPGKASHQLVLTCLLLSSCSQLVVKIETELLGAIPMSLKVGNWKLKRCFQFSFSFEYSKTSTQQNGKIDIKALYYFIKIMELFTKKPPCQGNRNPKLVQPFKGRLFPWTCVRGRGQ